MFVHNNINQLPQFQQSVITIGTFDGVHAGHRKLIAMMKEEAMNIQGTTILITFYPHPRRIIHSESTAVSMLNTMEEKISLLEQLGIDHLVIIPFNEIFANQSPEAYIEHFLVKNFSPQVIIIGHDHQFGKNRTGNIDLLIEKANQFHYQVKEIPGFMMHDITISSTAIRNALKEGDIEKATHYLGYHYQFTGLVEHGKQLGRTIGFPTANIDIEDTEKLVPGNGVYAVEIPIPSKQLFKKGMMNIGTRPTVDGTTRKIEVHIFDFNEDIYGDKLIIVMKKRIRNEEKFPNVDSLKGQLGQDKAEVEKYFETNL